MSQLAEYPKLQDIIQRLITNDPLTLIRCISRAELIDLLAELGEKTFDRLEQVGQGPPKTQLSDRRIGYRITDVAAWLDARRRPDTFVVDRTNNVGRGKQAHGTLVPGKEEYNVAASKNGGARKQ